MKIRIEDITEDGLQLNFSGAEDILSEALEAVPAPEGVKINPCVKGHVRLEKAAKRVLIEGEVHASIRLQCARCLNRFQVEKGIELNLKAGVGGTESSFRDTPEEPDEDTIIIDGPTLEIGEIIVQELLLEIPMKPLCREDCPGLCPQCGAMKGSADCKCRTEPGIDTRWRGLALLKKNDNSS
jgi:uncharacterized protein